MTTYLDVGVIHIQQYLARTRRLSGRRGASAMIRFATNRIMINGTEDPYLAALKDKDLEGWSRTDDAADIDGVISLKCETSHNDDQMRRIAECVITVLRSKLPGAEFSARWIAFEDGDQSSYVKAYRQMENRPELLSLPALSDYPALRPCDECGHRLIIHNMSLESEQKKGARSKKRLCLDCTEREDHIGRHRELDGHRDQVSASFSSEEALHSAMRKCYPEREFGAVDDMKDLADVDRELARSNHLATIVIDGNSIGELFGRISQGSHELQSKASKILTEVTHDALVKATQAIILDTDEKLPVIPHLVGGDDVLVSVVASRAWKFTTTFLDYFENTMKSRLNEHSPDDLVATASAGIVFARHNVPFIDTVEFGERQLKQAKLHAKGVTSAVSWLDLTQDDPDLYRQPLTIAELNDLAPALAELAQISNAGRSSLSRMVQIDDPVASRARILADAQRNDWRISGLTEWLPAVRADEAIVREGLRSFRNAIEMVRWWACQSN